MIPWIFADLDTIIDSYSEAVDCEDGGCEQCWLDWLKQEASE